MIKSIEFLNFRNLKYKYNFINNLNIIVGKNNSGKTNLLDGIRLAFSTITDEYFKIEQSDFFNSDDSNPIEINVELEDNSIPSLNYIEADGTIKTGFKVVIRKTQRGRYVKEISLLNGSNVDYEILKEDENLPHLSTIPLARIDNLFTNGFTASISSFLNSNDDYINIRNESKEKLKDKLGIKINVFKSFCNKFGYNLDIAVADPKITDEKIYVIDGDTEQMHGYHIGAGYRSVANIIINSMNEGMNIILIDEIENHLHPALIRTLIREVHEFTNIKIIGTTHSPVVLNELSINEITDISGKSLDNLDKTTIGKLKIFLHPGRGELILADNIILVEGYTEEMILKKYLYQHNHNWTVINVAGVMFEPYINLAKYLGKKVVVISDNDRSTSIDGQTPSSRFSNLKKLCSSQSIKLIEVDNTLETDLYNNQYIDDTLLKQHEKHSNLLVAKNNKKIEITEYLIESGRDLSNWHVIKEIKDEFRSD